MNERLVVAICIVVALLSFFGGVVYKYEEYRPITGELVVEDGISQAKYTAYFKMPVDTKTAYMWLDWAISMHQYYIDNEIITEQKPIELHQRYVDLYGKIRVLFQELDEECK